VPLGPVVDTNHVYVYVGVPVAVIVAETVSAWSTSSAAALIVGADGAASAVFTVIVDPVVEVFTKGSGVIVAEVVTPVSVTV
jgi:hypothetical protein